MTEDEFEPGRWSDYWWVPIIVILVCIGAAVWILAVASGLGWS